MAQLFTAVKLIFVIEYSYLQKQRRALFLSD